MPDSPHHQPVLDWYSRSARDLPWRERGATPWQVLVSEVMLQQTSVARVLPTYRTWVTRWPTSSALAGDSPGEAVRMWGRLGYPRRALRLHQAATIIETDFDAEVPATYEQLRRLPGIGDYTAAAVQAFAFGQRAVVLDSNVRRVLGRALAGREHPARSVTVAERLRAEFVLPEAPEVAAAWSVAVMELGALVCTARRPACQQCPLAVACLWKRLGYPAYDGPPRKGQGYDGTDRQCRGALLAVLRDADGEVPLAVLETIWPEIFQRERALASLVDDGLVVSRGEGTFELPS